MTIKIRMGEDEKGQTNASIFISLEEKLHYTSVAYIYMFK